MLRRLGHVDVSVFTEHDGVVFKVFGDEGGTAGCCLQ